MRTVKYFGLALLTAGLVAGLGAYRAADEGKPKHDIEEIMELAHKGKPSLYARVTTGKADKDDQKKLLELYQELAKNKPPKGSAKDWNERTGKMIAAAKAVVEGKDGAPARLKQAPNCMGCHKLHRGDD